LGQHCSPPARRCLRPRPGAGVKVERPAGRTTLTPARTAVASRDGGAWSTARQRAGTWNCKPCHAA
jgi:hypothetical protein